MTRIAVRAALLFGLTIGAAVSFAGDSVEDVPRIVAVGDVHGDYEQFVTVLRDADLIGKKNRWTGGKTHLVQLGDVPDRGPDTRKIMDFLIKLEKQAARAGGFVHALIGNHEAMNLSGDLRYVHAGEYVAFEDRKSAARQVAYFDQNVAHIKRTRPEEQWPVFDDAYRQAWFERFPLGYVEHRRAWAPNGKYGRWVLQHNAIVKINDTLFVHGGMSQKYADTPLAELNERVRTELKEPQLLGTDALVNDELGPLWYRALATADDQAAQEQALLEHTLVAQQAERIVIAHTPLTGTVVPRFDGRVIAVDVGLSKHYGGRIACLIIEGNALYTLHRGHKLALPQDDDGVIEYLQKAATLDPLPSPIDDYIRRLESPPESEAPAVVD